MASSDIILGLLNIGSVKLGTSDVKLCLGNKQVYPLKGDVILTFNVIDASNPTKVLNDTSNVKYIIIDGVRQSSVETGYTLTAGEHTIDYMFNSSVITSNVFSACTGIIDVEISDDITSISVNAFNGCSAITSCTIGSGVTSIGSYAFSSCYSLTSIVCNAATAPTIQSTTFQNVNTGGTLTVPSGSSGYDVWMGTGDYYLGKYNWTKYEYVEIGGIKWATMNVGANSVTDTGLYFQWGDTQGYTAAQVGSGSGQKAFTWQDYKFNPSGDEETMTKYNSTDGKMTLDAEDDAVTAARGSLWRIPTTAELQALGDAVNTAWTADYQGSGVAGLVCTDKTDSFKVLFFPAAGRCDDGSMRNVGSLGYYWSSSLDLYDDEYADSVFDVVFDIEGVYWGFSASRCYGLSVRGVLDE